MNNVNIYLPGKLNLDIKFPETWNELHQREIQYIAKQLLQEKDAAAARALILKYLFESRAPKRLPDNWFIRIDPELIVIDLYPIIDFIFLSNDLTNTPDRIELRGLATNFYPQQFENILCGEYEDAEVEANKFLVENDINHLANLSAILFRPRERGKVEPYIKFDLKKNHYFTYKTEKKAEKFKKLPPEVLYANFIWYAGCRAQLPGIFPTVYENSGKSETGPDLMAFTKCIHSGAGVKNGSRENIRVTKMYEYMYEMELEAIRYNEELAASKTP